MTQTAPGWSPAALARLHATCFSTPRPWSEAAFASQLADNATFLITRPQGFLIGRNVLDEAELLTLAVDPKARRQGHALALVTEFHAQALEKGAETAFLEVASDNLAARALYAAAGYQPAGRRPGYYRSPEGALIDAEILCKQLK